MNKYNIGDKVRFLEEYIVNGYTFNIKDIFTISRDILYNEGMTDEFVSYELLEDNYEEYKFQFEIDKFLPYIEEDTKSIDFLKQDIKDIEIEYAGIGNANDFITSLKDTPTDDEIETDTSFEDTKEDKTIPEDKEVHWEARIQELEEKLNNQTLDNGELTGNIKTYSPIESPVGLDYEKEYDKLLKENKDIVHENQTLRDIIVQMSELI